MCEPDSTLCGKAADALPKAVGQWSMPSDQCFIILVCTVSRFRGSFENGMTIQCSLIIKSKGNGYFQGRLLYQNSFISHLKRGLL